LPFPASFTSKKLKNKIMLYQLIYKWQALIGALVGAAAPISLWFLKELYERRKNRKDNLYRLEKLLVYNINNVVDARNTIYNFIENKLKELIERIKQREDGAYSIDTAFFPLFTVHPIDENIISLNTGSGYLDNKMIKIFKMSKDFASAIDDSRRQFTYTVEISRNMAFMKLISPADQRNQYIQNIEAFREMVRQDLFNKNIKTYIQILAFGRVGINFLRDIGISRWQFKFSPKYRFFRSKRELRKFGEATHERIDKFFKTKVNTQIKEAKALYKK